MESVVDLSLTHGANDTNADIDYSCLNSRALKGDYTEDMVMVNPSLVTGTNVQNSEQSATTQSVPVNLMLGDGTVLGQIKVNSDNGGIDLHTLQNLVSNQLLLTQQTELDGSKQFLQPDSPSSDNSFTGRRIALIACQGGEADLECLDPAVKIETEDAVKATTKTQTNAELEPKKHKGGWPKGRKRKPEKITNAPKPPSNAYRLYTMERRSQLREKYPKMSFAEQVRKMGAEWSHEVDSQVKKKYFDLAETDRKRYIEELKLYQESDTYQDYLSKKAKAQNSGADVSTDSLRVKEVYDPDILYCSLCEIYFSNNHNKTEHLMGAKHIKNVTKHFEEGIRKAKETEECLTAECGESVVQEVDEGESKLSDGGPLDVERFLLDFTNQSNDREQELQHLKACIVEAQNVNSHYAQEFIDHKNLITAMEQEVSSLKTVTSSLKAKLHNLYMVPSLFGLAHLL